MVAAHRGLAGRAGKREDSGSPSGTRDPPPLTSRSILHLLNFPQPPPAAGPADRPPAPPAPPTIATTLATLALTAAALGLAPGPPDARAELQTVTLDEATAAAKPLPQQPVRTGRVWALIGLGAAGVFGAAVAVENNEAWFPAIAKANKAMAATKARAAVEGGAARAEATGSGADAVAAGIAEASRRARERAAGGEGGGEGR